MSDIQAVVVPQVRPTVLIDQAQPQAIVVRLAGLVINVGSGGGGVTDHTQLTSIGTNTHAQIDSSLSASASHIANTTNPHNVTAAQVNADPAGTASTAVTNHEAALDPHPGYLTPAEGDLVYSAVGHNHNLADLTEKSYNSLTDKPTIPSVIGLLDETAHDLLDHTGLTGIPSVTGLLDETAHDLLDHTGLTGIPTQYTDEMAQDAIGSAIAAGTQTGITVAYDDVNNKIDFTVTAAGTGDVTGPASSTDSNFALFSGTTGKVIKDGNVKASDFATASHNHTGTYEPANANIQQHIVNTLNPHGVTASQVGLGNVTDAAQVLRTEMGAASGVATLGADGKVPSGQLPSYVDEVLEYANLAAFPASGDAARIYVALDTNLIYRWSGYAYVEISQSLALGETSATAYYGDKGKMAYDHSQSAHAKTTSIDATDHASLDHTGLTGISAPYALPTASTTVLGGVKVDGTSITIIDGVVSAAGTGTGDVVGPASAVSNNVAVFDGITGKLIKDSGVAVHDPVTVADSTSIDLTLTGQQISAAAIFGTTAGTISEGNHGHSGVYEPADPTILKDADIGVSVQAYDADLSSWAAIAPSAKQDTLVSGTNIKTINTLSLLGAGDLSIPVLTDGDKGNITVSNSGETWTVNDGNITNAKLAFDGGRSPYAFFKSDATSVTFTKTGAGTISIKAGTFVLVGDTNTMVSFSTTIAVVMPTLTGGTDYAIYACTDGTCRADASFATPTGYTTANSRLIGGFHYGLVAPGTTVAGGSFATSGTGMIWTQGDVDKIAGINEFSLWDLKWRSASTDPLYRGQKGFAYIPEANCWEAIYYCSTDHIANGLSKAGTNIASGTVRPAIPLAFGGMTNVDGTTTYAAPSWWSFNEIVRAYGCRLSLESEFVVWAYGVTENQSIDATTSTYPTTQRNPGYTSKYGIEQATGHHWTWGLENGGAAATAWTDTNGGRGQLYNNNGTKGLFSGSRALGAYSGSRCATWYNPPSSVDWLIGVRAAADHMVLI